MATTHDAILISVVAAVTVLIAHTYVGVYGFMRGAQVTDSIGPEMAVGLDMPS
jgi:hypothetical protein